MKDGTSNPQKSLEILAPSVFSDKNEIYVNKIKEAIDSEQVKNLALMGGYGTGKSSIILQFLESVKYKTKVISFLTFRWQEKSDGTVIEHKYSDEISRNMQTEIFKQLYFGLDPKYIPKTKYSRIGKEYPTGKSVCFVLSALGLMMSVFLLSILVLDSDFFNLLYDIALLFFGAVIDVAIFAICFVIYLTELLSSLRLKKIGFHNLSVDLSDDEPDFEQMLDEIIYAFKQARYKIVVFEDLDRFNNVAIIEELRQLNLILNNALDWKVTFIYTINDCLINKTIDRVKLFDAIIPVVPFMSEGNAQDYIVAKFKEYDSSIQFDSKILAVVSKYVNDMRELSYLFEIYKEYAHSVKNNLDEPLPDYKLLGLALLRCYYPTEVSLCNQETKLDKLFAKSSEKWNDKLNEIDSKLSAYEKYKNGKYTFIDAVKKDIAQRYDAKPEDLFVLLWDGNNISTSYEEISDEEFIDGIINENKILQITKKGDDSKDNSLNIDKTYLENCSGFAADFYQYTKNSKKFYYARKYEFVKNMDRFSYINEIKPDNDIDDGLLETVKDLVNADMLDEYYQIFLSKSLYMSSSKELLSFKISFLRYRRVSFNQKLSQPDIEELLPTLTVTDFANPALYNIQFINYIAIDHEKELGMIINQVKDRDGEDFMFKFLDIYCNHEINNMLNIIEPDKINPEIFMDVSILHFIQKLASNYPIKTISHILYNENTEKSGVKKYYFLAAISDINLKIPIIFKRDYSHKFKEYFDSAIEYGFATQISYVMCQNNYLIPDIIKLKDNVRAMEYAISSRNFVIDKRNIDVFSISQLSMIIEGGTLNADEMKIVIGKINSNHVELFDEIFENIDKIPQDTSVYDNLSEKIYLLEKERQPDILYNLTPKISEQALVSAILKMKNFISDSQLHKILGASSSNLSQISDSLGKKPTFPNTAKYRKFFAFLKDRKFISSFRLEGPNIRIVTLNSGKAASN